MPRTKRIDWDAVSDLGKVPDWQIAQRLGVTPASVWQARRRRGIGSATKRHAFNAPTLDELYGAAPKIGRSFADFEALEGRRHG